MIAKTTTEYKTIQDRRKTTYSNKPKEKFKPGNITINYTKTISNYTKNLGRSEKIEYLPNNSIQTINVQLNIDDLYIPSYLHILNILKRNFSIYKIQYGVSILELFCGIDESNINFPIPISITMHAYASSGSGNSVGLNKDIEASGFISHPDE